MFVLILTALLAKFGSGAGLDAVAVVVMVAAPFGVTAMAIDAVEPFAIVPRLHVTCPALAVHDPWLVAADPNVTMFGQVTVAATGVAAEGPLLVTLTA